MTVKEYFKQAFTIDRLLKATRAQLEEIREKRLCIGSITYGDKVQNAPGNESFNALSDLYLDFEQKLINDEIRLAELKIEILGHIEKLDNFTHKLIMTERYVSLKRWEDIAADNGYSWRNVHKIHGKALEAAKEFIEVHTPDVVQ